MNKETPTCHDWLNKINKDFQFHLPEINSSTTYFWEYTLFKNLINELVKKTGKRWVYPSSLLEVKEDDHLACWNYYTKKVHYSFLWDNIRNIIVFGLGNSSYFDNFESCRKTEGFVNGYRFVELPDGTKYTEDTKGTKVFKIREN